MGVDERLQTEPVGERRREEEPRVGHQAIVVKGGGEAVQTVG